jgi:hypothetical protein
MPITIHTSPAVVSGEQPTITTASFTSVSNGMLIAMVMATSDSAPTVSGGGLTWTRQVQNVSSQEYAEIWTAPVAAGASMTVSATIGGSLNALGLKVDVISGQHPSSPIGTNGTGATTTNNATVTGYVSTANASRGWCAAREGEAAGSPTSTDTGFGWTYTVSGLVPYAGIALRKAADTTNSGTTVTFNMDAAGESAANWRWAALEVIPAPPPNPRAPVMPPTALHRAASW